MAQTLVNSLASTCVGRVGKIAEAVCDLFNESTGGFLPDGFILRSINRCLQDLAQEDYCVLNLDSKLCRLRPHGPFSFHSRRSTAASSLFQRSTLSHDASWKLPGIRRAEDRLCLLRDSGVLCVQNDALFVWPPPSTTFNQDSACTIHTYRKS